MRWLCNWHDMCLPVQLRTQHAWVLMMKWARPLLGACGLEHIVRILIRSAWEHLDLSWITVEEFELIQAIDFRSAEESATDEISLGASQWLEACRRRRGWINLIWHSHWLESCERRRGSETWSSLIEGTDDWLEACVAERNSWFLDLVYSWCMLHIWTSARDGLSIDLLRLHMLSWVLIRIFLMKSVWVGAGLKLSLLGWSLCVLTCLKLTWFAEVCVTWHSSWFYLACWRVRVLASCRKLKYESLKYRI